MLLILHQVTTSNDNQVAPQIIAVPNFSHQKIKVGNVGRRYLDLKGISSARFANVDKIRGYHVIST